MLMTSSGEQQCLNVEVGNLNVLIPSFMVCLQNVANGLSSYLKWSSDVKKLLNHCRRRLVRT